MAELKIREAARYNAFYCGLCRAISGRYGQIPRSLLNYDCAFVALLLSGLRDGAVCAGLSRCAYRLHRGKRPMAACDTEEMRFCADLNVLLAYIKLEDDMRDEHKLLAYPACAVYHAAYRKARKLRPELESAIRAGIARLSALEKDACPEADEVANAFANMLVDVFRLAPLQEEGNRLALELLAFNLGRWIYLIDALDDRARDKKSGAYNPFNIADTDGERVQYMLYKSLNEAVLAYDLLDIGSDAAIIDNILRQGCYVVTQNVHRRAE